MSSVRGRFVGEWLRVFAAMVACWTGIAVSAARAAAADHGSGLSPESAAIRVEFLDDLNAIARAPSRVIGSPGYDGAADYLRSEIAKLPGVELREQAFTVMMPVTRSASLAAGGRTIAVYPFWPAGVRLNATPAGGIRGKLVYLGRGGLNELRPASVRRQIAVIEAGTRERWTRAGEFGAAAVLVLGDEHTTNADLRSQDVVNPVDLPRFYVRPDDAAIVRELSRHGNTAPAVLSAQVNWEPRRAVNLYALVGAGTRPNGWSDPTAPRALVLSAPYESSGLVPDLAPGAGQAVQAAAGLALLRDLARRPVNRPVLVAFTGADSVQMKATRNMLMALAQPPASWRGELDELGRRQKAVERELAAASSAVADPRAIKVRRDVGLIDRLVTEIEADLTSSRGELFDLRASPSSDARDKVARLEADQVALSTLRYAVRKDPRSLSDPLEAEARTYVGRAAARLERLRSSLAAREAELRGRAALYQWLAGRLGLPADPGVRDYGSRLIEALVAVDLADGGARVGPMYYGAFQQSNAIADVQEFRDWFARQVLSDRAASAADWYRRVRPALDLSPLTDGSRSPQTWLATSLPVGSEMAQAWGVPGFSLITLDDARLRRDTPNDVVPSLNIDAILPQVIAVREVIRHAWADPNFRGPAERRPARTNVTGQVVGPAPDRPIPDLPREGFLATYYYVQNPGGRIPGVAALPYTVGVRRDEVVPTDADGHYRFEGMPRLGPDPQMRKLAVQAYRLAPDTGAITGATDLGEAGADLPVVADLNTDPDPLRSVVFDCEEFSLFGLYDPRFLQTLGELLPLDARRNATPQRYDFVPANGAVAGFAEKGVPLELLFHYGSVGNRLVMLNVEHPETARDATAAARGFTPDELRHDPTPPGLQSARDFWRLNEIRMRGYAAAGVVSPQLDAMHASARRALDAAEAAARADDGAAAVSNTGEAWATEARVYRAVRDMGDDVVRGAIFLLLLCVPFAFCMERLLIASTNVYRQLGWSAGIFAVMTGALAAFHPAFKISTSPLVIVLAFAIVLMSGVVTWVIYQKFDSELKRFRAGTGHGEGIGVARAGVLMSAVLLGLASMRRRRFRTALTSVTIVLITFAVLCFTSGTSYLDVVRLPTGMASTAGPGVLLRQRGFRAMPAQAAESAAAVLGEMGVTPAPNLAEYWWNANPADPNEQIDVTAPGRTPADEPKVVPVAVVVGLSPAAAGALAPVVPAAEVEPLKRGDDVVYLPKGVADRLGVAVGATVKIAGIALRIAGVYDADTFDRQVNALNGEPLRPLSYRLGELDASGRPISDTGTAETLELGAGAGAAELQGSQTYEHVSSSRIVIVPAAVSRLLPNASLVGLSVPLTDDATVRRVSAELAKRFSLAIFAADSSGVSLVSAGELQSVSGAGRVAVPLAIGGLIIFNTMMGSIAERRREIHVYTSLGLAPMHVGALFIAEAFTYGLIGTVFGYIIGQGVGTLLSHFGLLGNVTLNYSGSSAIATMGLILLIVTASAIIPARMASKIAAPSIERTWRVPAPDGDQIIAHLPFTINKSAADGALAYLAEFFESNREGSVGKFGAGPVEPFTLEAHDGREHRGLQTTVWLTPFDLGVRQHLLLLIHPGEFPDIYEVQVVLQRLSGDDGSWRRLNRAFLTLLREQFLQWRSLSPQRMADFVEVSRVFFSNAPHIAAEPGVEPITQGAP